MDFFGSSDFVSLAEEKFDFDVSLSPGSSKGEDDDEVFVGPVLHKEKCISIGVEALVKDSVSDGSSLGEELSWSPLAEEKFDLICKEAHLLANQLGANRQQPDMEETLRTLTEQKEDVFVQDDGAKLNMLCNPVDAVLSPIKRETFCVHDSPLKQLPPAIQKRLLRAGGAVNPMGRVSTSSPVRGAQTQPKMTLRGRAGLAGGGGVLPNRPAAPSATTRLAAANTRAQPAEKTTRLLPPSSKGGKLGVRRSMASCNSSREGSSEDLVSDTTSSAADVSDSVLNSSLLGKKHLAPPSKSGLRGPSGTMKPPLAQTRRATDRTRNSSSSSSSVSSFNSSLSVSPAGKGQLNASLNSSGLASTNRVDNRGGGGADKRKSSLISRAPQPPATTRSSSTTTATTGGRSSSTTTSTRGGLRRSISTQGRKPSGPEGPKSAMVTPMKRPAPSTSPPLHQTPAKRAAMERTCSIPNISTASSAKGPNPKLKAAVVPSTPVSHMKGLGRLKVVSSPDLSLIMKPKKLMTFSSSVDSPAQKPAAVLLQTPSAGGNRSVQLRRPSALPTPVNRRTSSIPMFTPKGTRPSLSTSTLPSSTVRPSHWSPAQVKGSQQEGVAVAPGGESNCPAKPLQPFSLAFSLEDEPEADPTTTTTTDPQPEADPTTDPQPETQQSTSSVSMTSQDSPEPSKQVQEQPEANEENRGVIEEMKELGNAEESQGLPQTDGIATQEVIEQALLVDAPAPIVKPQEKLLIDLSNTPVLTRALILKPSGGQLIDLSSPLIRWSPEYKKENAANDAPLIDLSF